MKFKKIGKLAMILVAGVTLTTALTGCSDDDDSSEQSSQVSHKKKLTKKQRINKEVKREQKNYKGDAKVAYNKEWNAITITPTSNDFTDSVNAALNDGEGESQDWKKLTESFKTLSTTVLENTEVADISVALVNPDNPDKILYSAQDGKTTYDLAKDGNK